MKNTNTEVILWDGNKKLRGYLVFNESVLQFKVADFPKSDLTIEIAYELIASVSSKRIYNLKLNGLHIACRNGLSYDFIANDLTSLISMLKEHSSIKKV